MLKSVTRQVISLLVAQNYRQANLLTAGVRLSEEEIRGAILEYGRVLVIPPESAFDLMDFGEVKTSKIFGIRQWWVVMDLWTKEEGRSDLSIELTVLESDPVTVEIDNIHVL